MGIGYRIREAREKLGLTQTELAKLVGVTGPAITNYENNTSHPKEIILYKLLECLNVDANYLFQDEVPPKKDILTLDELQHIKNYRNLDKYGKKIVNAVMDIELERKNEQASSAPSNIRRVGIPTVNAEHDDDKQLVWTAARSIDNKSKAGFTEMSKADIEALYNAPGVESDDDL